MRLFKWLTVGLACVGLLLLFIWRLPAYQYAPKPHDVNAAIRQLSSADAIERLEAKRKLIELGANAVRPLLMLLEDLARHHDPRFPIGKEEEGAKALERYHQKLTLGEDMDPEESQRLTGLIINSRLRNDVISVLSQLHAVEAVPLLIEIMREEESFGASEHMSAAMEALKEIGEDAFPALIEAIEAADAKVPSATNAQALNEEETDISRRIAVFRIQARAAMVLGQIGDPGALPALEKLLHQRDNKFIVPYVEGAIEEIKRRSGVRNPRGSHRPSLSPLTINGDEIRFASTYSRARIKEP